MYCTTTMSMEDELDRPKSKAIGRDISLDAEGARVHAIERSSAVVAKTAAHSLLLVSWCKTQQ